MARLQQMEVKKPGQVIPSAESKPWQVKQPCTAASSLSVRYLLKAFFTSSMQHQSIILAHGRHVAWEVLALWQLTCSCSGVRTAPSCRTASAPSFCLHPLPDALLLPLPSCQSCAAAPYSAGTRWCFCRGAHTTMAQTFAEVKLCLYNLTTLYLSDCFYHVADRHAGNTHLMLFSLSCLPLCFSAVQKAGAMIVCCPQ